MNTILFAPLQGYTDHVYRNVHARLFRGVDAYYTPFIRIEKGEPRRQDISRLQSPLNEGVHTVPQIIFSDADEFRRLAGIVVEAGYNEIDLNIGCPFPMQTRRGRGCALMSHPETLADVAEQMRQMPQVKFSLKMRCGENDSDGWQDIADAVNEMPLSQVAFHPRTGKQKYDGELAMDAFGEFLKQSKHPVIYNGDLHSPADIADIYAKYPGIAGVIIGRGLLARPSLAEEYVSGEEWTEQRRISALVRLNEEIGEVYERDLCGDVQILSKLRPLWDYAEPIIGRRAWKAIHKAHSLRNYHAAVAAIAD